MDVPDEHNVPENIQKKVNRFNRFLKRLAASGIGIPLDLALATRCNARFVSPSGKLEISK